MEEKAIQELSFPLAFEKCPVCGCEETIAALEVDKEKKKGTIGKDVKPCVITQAVMVVDPRLQQAIIAPRPVPTLLFLLDVCARCGVMYCRRVEKTQGHMNPVRQMGRG